MIDIQGVITTVIKIVSILLVLYVFEITKAISSTVQGDTMPKEKGMLTPNIFKYFEPIGFLLTFFYGYGWGQPAPVSSRFYKNKKTGSLITHLTPIIVSFILSVVLSIVVNIINNKTGYDTEIDALGYLGLFLLYLSQYFLRIAVFNLIPIPPMCGYEILKCFLSPNAAFRYGQNAHLIQMAFLFLWFFGLITPMLNSFISIITSIF